MMKNKVKYSPHQKQIVVNKPIKRCLAALCIFLIAIALIVCFSLALSTSSAQTIKNSGSETQFKFDVAYAYVAKFTANATYNDSNSHLMSLVSQYPSVVVFNITRLPGVKIASCDAVIEVYGVHITTNTGEAENYAYIVGTNFSSTFSPSSELHDFIPHIHDIINQSAYSGGIKGDLYFNWSDNTSILSHRVGSMGLYSTLNSTLGLWSAGRPNEISVTVNRIGYITTSNGSVSVYKDESTNTATATQHGNYEDGFLHNTLVPAAKLSQTNLFEPTQTNQHIPTS